MRQEGLGICGRRATGFRHHPLLPVTTTAMALTCRSLDDNDVTGVQVHMQKVVDEDHLENGLRVEVKEVEEVLVMVVVMVTAMVLALV